MSQQKYIVALSQINNSFSGANYLPYSVGLLQVYAEKHLKEPDRFEFLLPLYKRCKVDDGVKHFNFERIFEPICLLAKAIQMLFRKTIY